MSSIPLWTVPLTFDSRQILAWGLEHFTPPDSDGDMSVVMRTAVTDKAASVIVDAVQLDYLDKLGCAALASLDAIRIDAPKFLRVIDDVRKRKADGVRETVKTKAQKTMFE